MAKEPEPKSDRADDRGRISIGGRVVYDGEAEALGLPSTVGKKVPLPDDHDDKADDD